MARSVKDLTATIGRVADSVDRGRKDTVQAMALAAKDEFLKGPERVGLSRNSRLAGGKWGVGFDLKGARNPVARVRYRGPVHWFEYGTGAHFITPKGFTGSRQTRGLRAAESLIGVGRNRISSRKVGRGARRALKLPDGGIRTTVRHPGTRPRPFFKRVQKDVAKLVGEVTRADINRHIRRAGWGR